MSKYKILIFDADGTLFDFEKSESEALKLSFKYFKIKYMETIHLSVYKKINKDIWTAFEEGKISANDLKPERFRRYTNYFGISVNEFDFSNIYLKYLSESAFLLSGAEEFLIHLKTIDNFNLILLTNGLTNVQKKRFEIANMSKYFDSIIISEEVGVKKPQKEIFELALKNSGMKSPEEVLMIGDNLSSDIKGGNNYGIDTCWYNPNQELNNDVIVPKFSVKTYAELLKIIL